jgi:GntR family mannosyl-D-glycerate transport/metabolism transcriptional repressor
LPKISASRERRCEATRLLIEQQRIYRVKARVYSSAQSAKAITQEGFMRCRLLITRPRRMATKALRKVIKFSIMKVPTPEMAQSLRIKNSDQIYKILRLMCFDDIPVALEHIHLPVNMFTSMELSQLEILNIVISKVLPGKRSSAGIRT